MTTAPEKTAVADCYVLRPGIGIEPADGAVRLTGAVGSVSLGKVTDGLLAALRGLRGAPRPLHEVLDPLTDWERRQVRLLLDRLGYLFDRCVLTGGRELVRIERITGRTGYTPAEVPAGARLKLSKFAFCRSKDHRMVLESPLVKHRVVLTDPAARAVVGALGAPSTTGELGAFGLDADTLEELLGHLVGVGVVDVDADGFASDTDPVLRQWDFHDLLFHSRSRSGRYDDLFGGVFPYVGEIEPQPAVKPVPTGTSVPLYRPSWAEITAKDPSLAAVMEGRMSIRQYGAEPLDVRQLGEFLYRVGRVRARYGPTGDVPYDIATRPYPCGGAAYELDLYLTVRRCAGLEPGIYFYDPVEHRLVLVNDGQAHRDAMLGVAATATAGQADPEVLITLTSRFQRVAWKYRAIAYAVTLRHAGVLYQTMYLVATAMGLAPCGLGSGDSDLAADAFGLDYLRESSVGDFLLGSHPGDAAVTAGAPPEHWRAVNNPEWLLHARELLPGRES